MRQRDSTHAAKLFRNILMTTVRWTRARELKAERQHARTQQSYEEIYWLMTTVRWTRARELKAERQHARTQQRSLDIY